MSLAVIRIAFVGLFAVTAFTQTTGLSTSNVSGPFYFRNMQFTIDVLGNLLDSRTAQGVMTFNGAGIYTVNALQSIDTAPGTSLTGNGTYSIGSSGIMAIQNPQRNSLYINARLGTEAIVGSTTESGDNTFDLFIAIPAGQGGSAFSGTYYTSSLDFPSAVNANVRSSLFAFASNSSGAIPTFSLTGHALNINSGQIASQNISGASYSLTAAGIGTMNFGSTSNNIGGAKQIYVSADGNILMGGALDGSSQDFIVGVRAYSGTAALGNWSGLYYTGGLRYDPLYPTSAGYVGGWKAVPTLAQVTTYQREHQLGVVPFDYTSYQPTALSSGATYYVDGLYNALGLGSSATSFVAADIAVLTNTAGTQIRDSGYSIDFGILAPTFASTGVYINPVGIVSAASLSPFGGAIAPGEFISIFGTGLAAQSTSAKPPFPASLGDVTVSINGILAPLSSISPNQINTIVPYGVSGSFATVLVTNAGQASNSITVPLEPTAPGVFTADSSGTGLGAILHANGKAVTVASPAARGETVSIFMTGLGAVTSAITDGVAISGADSTVAAVTVIIAGQTTSVQYAGLAPGFPGVYQVNVVIPAGLIGSGLLPLIIQTIEGLDEQADIAIQ